MAMPLYESEQELETLGEQESEFEAEFENESELEAEFEQEAEAGLEGEGWLGAIGNVVGSLLGESEFESESELENEFEAEISPIRKIYPDAMMEHLGELAAEAESEQEAAEHFLPLIGMAASKLLPVVARAVAPMAKRALPRIAKAVSRATPQLTRGVGKVARGLYRNPETRGLLRAVPTIARRTVGSIARQAAHGRRITPRGAVMTLARQTQRVLGNRQQRRNALRRHQHLERRFHGRWGRGMARPHWRYGRRRRGVGGYYAGPGYAAPGYARPGYAGPIVPGGQLVAGYPRPAGCPSCGSATGAPAYCRCCGQVLR
jgi:hypothetical protein